MRIRGLLLAILSFLYWALRRLLELLVLSGRGERAKEVFTTDAVFAIYGVW